MFAKNHALSLTIVLLLLLLKIFGFLLHDNICIFCFSIIINVALSLNSNFMSKIYSVNYQNLEVG